MLHTILLQLFSFVYFFPHWTQFSFSFSSLVFNLLLSSIFISEKIPTSYILHAFCLCSFTSKAPFVFVSFIKKIFPDFILLKNLLFFAGDSVLHLRLCSAVCRPEMYSLSCIVCAPIYLCIWNLSEDPVQHHWWTQLNCYCQVFVCLFMVYHCKSERWFLIIFK